MCRHALDMRFRRRLTSIRPTVGFLVILGDQYRCVGEEGLDQRGCCLLSGISRWHKTKALWALSV